MHSEEKNSDFFKSKHFYIGKITSFLHPCNAVTLWC